MDLELPSSTYERYKHCTTIFTSWLSRAAKKCGWKPPKKSSAALAKESLKSTAPALRNGPRLKGKARKEQRQAELHLQNPQTSELKPPPPVPKYRVTTQDLIQQVEIVSLSGKVSCPKSIHKALTWAIDLRKQSASFFQGVNPNDQVANEGHVYFIAVLEVAAELLATDQGATEKGSGSPDQTSDVNQSFKNLRMDDADDAKDTSDLSDIDSILRDCASDSQMTDAELSEYELVPDADIELTFKIFCFFEDLHTLQEEVQMAWHSYKAGTTTLIAATIITTIAIEIAGRAERELISAYPRQFHKCRSYQDFTLHLFGCVSLLRGVDYDNVLRSEEDLVVTPLKKFLYLPVAKTLLRAASRKVTFQSAGYPVPLIPMRFEYLARPDLLEQDHMRKLEADDELLCQLLQELKLVHDFHHSWKRFGQKAWIGVDVEENDIPAFHDVFSHAMRKVWQDGEVRVRGVFAAQLMLNIVDICGPEFRGSILLRDEGLRYMDLYQLVDDGKVIRVKSGLLWGPKDSLVIGEVLNRIQRQMIEPRLPGFKEIMLSSAEPPTIRMVPASEQMDKEFATKPETDKFYVYPRATGALKPEAGLRPITHEQLATYYANGEKLDLQVIMPNKNLSFFMDGNPLYCGTLMLSQTASTEEAGIALANHLHSVYGAAHLYNAMHKLNLTNTTWSLLERVIDLHATTIFGATIPSEPGAMWISLRQLLGIQVLPRGVAKFNFNEKKRDRLALKSSSSARLLLQFFQSRQPLEKTIHQLVENIARRQPVDQTNGQRRPRRWNQRQFFGKLESFASTTLADMEIPYIGLARECARFLEVVGAELDESLGVNIAELWTHEDVFYRNLTAAILYGNTAGPPSAPFGTQKGELLSVAVKAFGKFWASSEKADDWTSIFAESNEKQVLAALGNSMPPA